MSSSCQALLNALKKCLLHSDCVAKSGHLPSECLKQPELYTDLPEQCKHLRQATFECKRGMLDMRKRFRGNHYGITEEQFEVVDESKQESVKGSPTPSQSSA